MQTHDLEPEQIQWCHNCLLIRQNPIAQSSFAMGGDSGAMLFDEDGNAVGLLFGCLFSASLSTIYGLASPMEVVLKKLEEKTGRKLKLKTEFGG